MDVKNMLEEAMAERENLREQLRNVDRVIEALKIMNPEYDSPVPKPVDDRMVMVIESKSGPFASMRRVYPKPRDAVLRAMESAPGRLFAPRDVTARVRELGMYNPDLVSGATAYSTALARLADEGDGPVRRERDGLYFYDATVVTAIRGAAISPSNLPQDGPAGAIWKAHE